MPARRVVLITGATLYLGGPCTLRPLRQAAPNSHCGARSFAIHDWTGEFRALRALR